MESDMLPLSAEDYNVAIICPMGKELAAMSCMLDIVHPNVALESTSNAYTFGQIGLHNVVIAVMPATGNNRAASAANQLLNDFRGVRFALLVGIGGGVPSDEVDIRLGDVVVGKPSGARPAVIQYDMGKFISEGRFTRTGILKAPSKFLLAATEKLQAQHLMTGDHISQHIEIMLQKYPEMRKNGYARPRAYQDPVSIKKTADAYCETTQDTRCQDRSDNLPRIHYGCIGSGNAVIKDILVRDRLRRDLGIVCVDMEAAGIIDELDCLVVRGISDYADAYKNDDWQPYAAAAAAGFAKDLLLSIPAITHTKRKVRALDASTSKSGLGCHTGDAPVVESHLFVGRQAELEQISSLLLHNRARSLQHLVVLGGLGGVGKTQLALEFVRRHQTSYDSILWLDATSELSLKSSLRSYAQLLPISYQKGTSSSEDQKIEKVLSWLSLRQNSSWLLIYDNHDDPRQYDIQRYLPSNVKGHIIITTRSPDLLRGHKISVSTLEQRLEGLDLLSRRSNRASIDKDPGSLQLVARLDGLPLALATAGAFLKRSNLSCQEYLESYERDWKILMEVPNILPEYRDRTLYTTWNMSFRQVKHENPTAAEMLRLLAYFDKTDISHELIRAGLLPESQVQPNWYVELATSRLRFENTMRTLVDFCLIEVDSSKKSYNLHSCVHDWIKNVLDTALDKDLYTISAMCTIEILSVNINSSATRLARFFQHARYLGHPRFHNVIGPEDCQLAFRLAPFSTPRSRVWLYELALTGFDAAYPHEPSMRHSGMLRLAGLHRKDGENEKALGLIGRLLSELHAKQTHMSDITTGVLREITLIPETCDTYGTVVDTLEMALAQVDITQAQSPIQKLNDTVGLAECFYKQGKMLRGNILLEWVLVEGQKALEDDTDQLCCLKLDVCKTYLYGGDLRNSGYLIQQLLAERKQQGRPLSLPATEFIFKLMEKYKEAGQLEDAIELGQQLYYSSMKLLTSEGRTAQCLTATLGYNLSNLCVKELLISRERATKQLCKLIDLTLTEPELEPLLLGRIAFVLRKLEHSDDARIAMYYSRILKGRGLIKARYRCDECEKRHPYQKEVFVCNHCFDVVLCSTCFPLYESGRRPIKKCDGREFFNPSESPFADVGTSHTEQLSQKGTHARAWLHELRGMYSALLKEEETKDRMAVLFTDAEPLWFQEAKMLKRSIECLHLAYVMVWKLFVTLTKAATITINALAVLFDRKHDVKSEPGTVSLGK